MTTTRSGRQPSTTLEELRTLRPSEYAQLMAMRVNEIRRLLNVRRMQTGARAAATQRKIDSIYRDTPGIEAWVKEQRP